MDEAQLASVKEHPLEAQRRRLLAPGERPIEGEIAVFRIADDRMSRVGEMDADLMRPPGLDRHVEEAEAGEATDRPHQADRAPASLVVGVDRAHVAAAI